MLFIKFGKKEHLEQLRNGIVHFSTFYSNIALRLDITLSQMWRVDSKANSYMGISSLQL